MIRWAAKAIMAVLTGAASIAADEPPENAYPEPPPAIAERIIDGRFEPGNFEYLRGYFPEASEAEKAEYAAIDDWVEQCGEEGELRLNAELAELGVALEGGNLIGAASLCQQVIRGEHFKDFASYPEVADAMRGARLVFDTLVQSIERAEQRTGPFRNDNLGADLHHRTLGEQMLRLAYRWGWQEVDEARNPKLTLPERTAFLALLNGEVLRVDHENTVWLKQIVAEHGWPTIPKAGERGANAAWLLTQHADLDPAFQLRALRMMEPLVENGEVSRHNYAYLYDRVMLKLVGTQRYATQLTCENGVYVPQPLEDAGRVDELRAEVDLEPLVEYRANFPATC